ncbi:MAG TPA: PilZ domain-containing protein [Armatimonadetes bacterium]|jgi:hypothetical protein|nr:PilZ domain-containing protein [Armatimonadota bacterium]
MEARHELIRMLVPGCRAIIAYAGRTLPVTVHSACDAGFRVQIHTVDAPEGAFVVGERVAVLAQNERGLGFFDTHIRGSLAGSNALLDLEWPLRYEWRPRREHTRVQERIPVTLFEPGRQGQSGASCSGHTLDVSIGGLQLFLAGDAGENLKPGQQVNLLLELPDGWPPLEATAMVVRAMAATVDDTPGLALGLQFIAASEQAWDRISRYVQVLMRRASERARRPMAGPRRAAYHER